MLKRIFKVIKVILILVWFIAAFFGFFDLFMVFVLNNHENKYVRVLPTNIAWVTFTILVGIFFLIKKIKLKQSEKIHKENIRGN